MTITEKDRLNFIAFQDRIETDVQMCDYAKEIEKVPNKYMDMIVRERLIEKEIICHRFKKKRVISSWLDTDEKWKKIINIL